MPYPVQERSKVFPAKASVSLGCITIWGITVRKVCEMMMKNSQLQDLVSDAFKTVTILFTFHTHGKTSICSRVVVIGLTGVLGVVWELDCTQL